jgi:hypothetical protein
MKKVLLIALVGGTCFVTQAFGQDQELLPLPPQEVSTPQVAQAAPPAPRPATAPAAPAPPSAARPTPVPAPTPPAAPVPLQAPPAIIAPPVPVRAGQPDPNVRFDVTITDTGGPKPVTKTMALTIGSGNNSGSVRQTAQAPNPTPGPPMIPIALNVDVRNVRWLGNNSVLASVAVEYQPYLPDAKVQPGMVVANATSVFFDGRRTQILVTSDPVSDRKTTIEVTATVLK